MTYAHLLATTSSNNIYFIAFCHRSSTSLQPHTVLKNHHMHLWLSPFVTLFIEGSNNSNLCLYHEGKKGGKDTTHDEAIGSSSLAPPVDADSDIEGNDITSRKS